MAQTIAQSHSAKDWLSQRSRGKSPSASTDELTKQRAETGTPAFWSGFPLGRPASPAPAAPASRGKPADPRSAGDNLVIGAGPPGSAPQELVEDLLLYAKSLTASRAFALYYVEMAVREFLDHGGSFQDGSLCAHPAVRQRLYAAFHRVWRGARASLPDGNGNGAAEEPELALRRAAWLLAEREGFSAADIACILNQPSIVVAAWLRAHARELRDGALRSGVGDLPGRLWPELATAGMAIGGGMAHSGGSANAGEGSRLA